MQASLVQHLHCRLEAFSFDAADQLAGRNPDILEDDIAGERAFLAHFLVRLAKRKAGAVALNDKGADPVCPFDIRRRAGHHGEDIRDRRIGDETFGSVENIEIAVAHGRGFQRGCIRACIRLGQAEGAEQLTAGEPGQIIALLLIRAVDENAD